MDCQIGKIQQFSQLPLRCIDVIMCIHVEAVFGDVKLAQELGGNLTKLQNCDIPIHTMQFIVISRGAIFCQCSHIWISNIWMVSKGNSKCKCKYDMI